MRRRVTGFRVLTLILVVWVAVGFWHTHKMLVPGVALDTGWYRAAPADIGFIADITSADAYGRPVMSQAIFDESLRIIRNARRLVVLDYFLFNSLGAQAVPQQARPLTRDLGNALIARKRELPSLRILFVTDPINNDYGRELSADLARLQQAGIEVEVTPLEPLRDSNPIYSAFWRLAIRWWASSSSSGALPNPFDDRGPRVSFGSWARLLNFKANHRKVLIADDGHDRLVGLIGSANPHDASAAHSNVAFRVQGDGLQALLDSEMSIAAAAGWHAAAMPRLQPFDSMARDAAAESPYRMRFVTEGAIQSALLARLNETSSGDAIDVAMFYLSDREVVDALLSASRRGVVLRILLDPNKDAFGHEKMGIPNRPVAGELVTSSGGNIRVRWYRTHGEQFHTKMVAIYGRDRFWVTAGSANLTRRNLDNFNLEANVIVETPRSAPLAQQIGEYFQTLWNNRAPLGIEYTADFDVYADPAPSRYWTYRLLESTGLATF